MLGSDCHHDAIQSFSTNCIICLCSHFPLFYILEGKGTVIFVYVIQAKPGVELQLYPWVTSEGDGVNGEIEAPVAFHLGKKLLTNRSSPFWANLDNMEKG
jgi:hypothetical protein